MISSARTRRSLGRLHVDDQLELGRLLDREVGGLGARENPACVDGGAPVLTLEVDSVCQQEPSPSVLSEKVDAGQPMPYR